jgi:hypothetical protein
VEEPTYIYEGGGGSGQWPEYNENGGESGEKRKMSMSERGGRNGFSKNLPNSKHAWAFLLASVIEAVIVIVLESIVFELYFNSSFSKGGLGKGIPIYLIIFVFSQIFQIILAYDAVRAQNTIQIIGFVLFNVCCLVYAIFQLTQIKSSIDHPNDPPPDKEDGVKLLNRISPFLISVAIVLGTCDIIYMYLGARLYQEFGWRIYKKIGADPKMRNNYRWYQIFLMLLKLDIFFFLGFSIQFLVLVLHAGDIEYPLTVVALPVTVLLLFVAAYAVRHESHLLMWIFLGGVISGMAYFIFKLFRMYDSTQTGKYLYTHEIMTLFASISLFLLTCTAGNAIICFRNFDSGLKQHILRDSAEHVDNNQDRRLSLD